MLLVLLLGSLVAPACADPTASPRTHVRLPVRTSTVTIVEALPRAEDGAHVGDASRAFARRTVTAQGGFVSLELGREPLYVLEGDTVPTNPVPAEQSPFGFHPANVGSGPRSFSDASTLGIRWHRGLYAYWILVQPGEDDIRRGVFRWEKNDREWTAVPAGMAILANIGLPERLEGFRRGRGPGGEPNPIRSTWRLNRPEPEYLAFVRAVVKRYSGDASSRPAGLKAPILTWQVENEPDLGGCTDWEGFAHIQEITYRAIKEACPRARVAMAGQSGGGLAVFESFYVPILRKLGGRCVDIYDLHYYGDARLDWKQVEAQVRHIRATLDRLGYRKTEIWITETGTYAGTLGSRRPPTAGARMGPPPGFDPPQTEREQARDVVKRYVASLATGVRKVFWAFGLADGFQGTDGFFDHTGFIYSARTAPAGVTPGTRKLAYHAYGQMTRMLDGADWTRVEKPSLGTHVEGCRVARGRGRVSILWYDPPYRLSDIVPAADLAEARRQLALMSASPSTADNATPRMFMTRQLIVRLLAHGGRSIIEGVAPRTLVLETERKVRERVADAPARVDDLIRRLHEAVGTR